MVLNNFSCYDEKIHSINDFYKTRVEKLNIFYEAHGEGQTRKETGNLFQDLFYYISKVTDERIILKRNDFLTIPSKSGRYNLTKVQVDWHGYLNNKLCFICECKAHLDKCYLSRAVSDINIIRKVHKNIPAIIFCGQRHISENTLNFYKEECNFEYFFINEDKKRSSKTPLYKTCNPLDNEEVKKVIEHIKNLTK